mmetsp:Transcript_22336/g.55058  ORF Transcript_22336/g.55058 Transcript_22336/m.55058 type:complete len:88 (-) Transcript_22336:472-735(-)
MMCTVPCTDFFQDVAVHRMRVDDLIQNWTIYTRQVLQTDTTTRHGMNEEKCSELSANYMKIRHTLTHTLTHTGEHERERERERGGER